MTRFIILIVEDNDDFFREIRDFLQELLSEKSIPHHEVVIEQAKNADQAESFLRGVNFACLIAVVIDYRLPGRLGTDLITKISPQLTGHSIPTIGTSVSEQFIPRLTEAGCSVGCSKVKLAYTLCEIVVSRQKKTLSSK